jgi:hypothetical protein
MIVHPRIRVGGSATCGCVVARLRESVVFMK